MCAPCVQFKTRCLAMMKSLKSCKREIKPLIGGPGLAVSWKPFRVSRAGCRHSAGHLCMCFSPINGSGPAYLSELQHVYTPSLTLCSSSDTRMLKIQQCECKTHGFRTFSCFGPHIWNSFGIHSHKTLDTAQPTLRASLSSTFLRRKDVVNQCLEFVLSPVIF